MGTYRKKQQPTSSDGYVDVTNQQSGDGYTDVSAQSNWPGVDQPSGPSLWQRANTGLISGDTISNAPFRLVGSNINANQMREDIQNGPAFGDNSPLIDLNKLKTMTTAQKQAYWKSLIPSFKARQNEGETPSQAALRTFAEGTELSAGDTLSSFTSPVSLAMMGTGAVAKAAPAASRIGQAARILNKGAGIGFGAKGVQDMVTSAPDLNLNLQGGPETLGIGANPEAAQQFLTGMSMASGGAADVGETIPKVRNSLRGSLASRTVPDSGGLTTGDVYNEMRDRGVNMNLAQAGQGKFARWVDDMTQRTPGGAGRAYKFRQNQAQQYADAVHGLEDQFDPTGRGTDIADRGAQMQRALETSQDVAHQNASDAFKQTLGDLQYTTADTSDIASTAQSLKSKLMEGQLDTMKPTQAIGILDEIINRYGDTHNNKSMVDDLFRDRSRLMKSQFTDSLTPGEAEGVMRQMGTVMRNSLENAAIKAGKGQAFNDAMSGWQDYLDTYGDRSSPVNRALAQADPTKVLEPFLNSRGTGSLNAIRMLKKVAPDFVDMLKRDFVRRLYDPTASGVKEDFGSMQKNLLRYNEPFLKELFSPEELKSIRALTAGGRSMNFDINPSGSGKYSGQTAAALGVGGGAATSIIGMAQHDPFMGALGATAALGIPAASYTGARVLESTPLTDFLMGRNSQNPSTTISPAGSVTNQGSLGSRTIANPFGQGANASGAPGRRFGSQRGAATPDLLPGFRWVTNKLADMMGGDDNEHFQQALQLVGGGKPFTELSTQEQSRVARVAQELKTGNSPELPAGSTINLRDNPLSVPEKPNLTDLGQALMKFGKQQGLKPLKVFESKDSKMIDRASTLAQSEAQYELAQNSSNTEWYRKEIQDMIDNMSGLHPELKDAKKATFFKAIVAAASLGNDSANTMRWADGIYSRYKSEGSIPMDQGRVHEDPAHPNAGKPVNWPGQGGKPVLGTIQKLLDHFDGDQDKVADFLMSDHTIGELRTLKGTNSGLAGKAGDSAKGYEILGDKAGNFFANMNGIPTELTGDRWFNRTWNRWMGTLIEKGPDGKPQMIEAPRNNEEMRIQRAAMSDAAQKLGMDIDQLQAILWYHEQQLYKAHGIGTEQLTYGQAAKQHVEKIQSGGYGAKGQRSGAAGPDAATGNGAAGNGSGASEVRTKDQGSSSGQASSEVQGETQRDRRQPLRRK